MEAIKQPVKAYEGASWSQVLQLVDEYNNPADLSGYTALLQIRPAVPSPEQEGLDPLLELSTDNGGIVIDAELGRISLYIDRVSESFQGVYDLIIYSPNGMAVKLIATSKFTVVPGVTFPRGG